MSLLSLNKIIPTAAFAVMAVGFAASMTSGHANAAAAKNCFGNTGSKLAKCCERLANLPSNKINYLTSAHGCGTKSVSCRRVQWRESYRYECYNGRHRVVNKINEHSHDRESRQPQQPAGKL